MDHLANGMKIKTPPDHKRMKYLAQCVCVWVSQSVSRVPVLIFAVAAAAALTADRFPPQSDEQELRSSPAMYRSASLLDCQEVMALYAGHRKRYCLKDDGSISEVRDALQELQVLMTAAFCCKTLRTNRSKC